MAWLLHPYGSWARATATGNQPPVVHQAGPRRLWDHLDNLRDDWLRNGTLPAYGSAVIITRDGTHNLQARHMEGHHTRLAARWTRLDPAEYPFVHQVATQLREHDDREQFLAGVDLILAGIGTVR